MLKEAGRLATAVGVSMQKVEIKASLVHGTRWDKRPTANEETRFTLARLSKLLTAARVVRMAKTGAFSLDDSNLKLLPRVLLLGASGADQFAMISLRAHLRHRSGFPKQPLDLMTKVKGPWADPALLTKLTGTPGQYSYSNFGYALLGAVVERVGKCSFSDCMGAYLKELGMEQSTFWPGTVGPNAAPGRTLVNGTVTFNSPAWNGSRYAIPFTGLWTSMPDLARFGSILIAAASDVNASLYEMTVGTGHGLGPIHGTALGAPSLEHDGSGPGFHAALVFVSSKKMTVALAANEGNETEQEAEEFTRAVQAVLLAVEE